MQSVFLQVVESQWNGIEPGLLLPELLLGLQPLLVQLRLRLHPAEPQRSKNQKFLDPNEIRT